MDDRLPPLLRPQPGPRTLVQTPWGGARLARLRGAASSGAGPSSSPADGSIGESWEFSTLPGRESYALGKPLSRLLDAPLPFLVKLIDTARALSIQVHPDDDPSVGLRGKEEAWMILDAEPGAHVFAGLAEGVDMEQFERAVALANSNPPATAHLVACLNMIPVEAGMVLLIRAGTVHAIGGGILLAELQQPTDCTLRLHDYGSRRDLHVERALTAMDPEAQPGVWHPQSEPTQLRGKHLRLTVLSPGHHFLVPDPGEPHLLTALSGPCTVREVVGGRAHELAAGDLALALDGPLDLLVPSGSLVIDGHHR